MAMNRERKCSMKRAIWLTTITFVLLAMISCEESSNPLPTLTSLSKTSRVTGMSAFTLKVNGEDFVQGAQIVFNGVSKDTKYMGTKELSAEITTEEIDSAFSLSKASLGAVSQISVPVYVKNPLPGGGKSSTIQFIIRDKFTFRDATKLSDLKETAFGVKAYTDKYNTIHCSWELTDDSSLWLAYIQTRSQGEQFTSVQYIQTLTLSETTGKKIEIVSGENKNTYAFFNYIISNTDGTSYKLLGAMSEDNGSTFGDPVFPADTTNPIEDYSAGTYGTGNIFCSWLERNTDDVGIVLFSRSVESGANFSTVKQLNLSNAFSGVTMAVDDNGVIYIAWIASDIATGKDAIYYTYSNDFGLNFAEQRQIAIAASTQQNFRKLYSLKGPDGKIYMAWWQVDNTNPALYTAKIIKYDAGCACFDFATIASFEELDVTDLPDIQLAADKMNNIYSMIVTQNSVVNLYRSTDGTASFHQIAETYNLGSTGPASFTLDEEGGIYIFFPLLIEYSSTDDDGNAITETATEIFLTKSNE